MTPKEKAEDIWVKYYELIDDIYSNEASKKIAKMYAILTVNEIIDANGLHPNDYDYNKAELYWQEVKQQIKKTNKI
jgi:hypothetical protein